MRTVLITGVSTGIGFACARRLTARGVRVYGSLRNRTDADRVSAALGPHFTPLIFDITDAAAVTDAVAELAQQLGGARLDALVNNAGIALAGPSLDVGADAFRQQFEVNLFGPVHLTSSVLPLLRRPAAKGDRLTPRIVNMSSVSGRFAAPFLAPYAASKFALEAWSDALRRELMLLGIDVVVIAPASIRTPIWDKAEQQDFNRYAATPYADALRRLREMALREGRSGLAADTVAQAVLTALTNERPKPRYFVGPWYSPMRWLLPCLPGWAADKLVAHQLQLRYKPR